MKFIHVTDTHLVAPNEILHGLNPAQRFTQCIDNINRHHSDAHCCVVTGDLTDRAESSAYQLLAEQIQHCAIPCHLMMGNHDDREQLLHWFPTIPVDENGFVQYTVQTPAGVFVLLDTTQFGTHSGVYCQQRRIWLSSTLQKHSNQPVYLFMHHPPFPLHLPSVDQIGFSPADQQAFADLVFQHSNIRHLFFGHAHRPLSGNWRGLSFSSLRGTNHQVKLDFANESISYADEPPEYSVVFLSEQHIVVHTHAYSLGI